MVLPFILLLVSFHLQIALNKLIQQVFLLLQLPYSVSAPAKYKQADVYQHLHNTNVVII